MLQSNFEHWWARYRSNPQHLTKGNNKARAVSIAIQACDAVSQVCWDVTQCLALLHNLIKLIIQELSRTICDGTTLYLKWLFTVPSSRHSVR